MTTFDVFLFLIGKAINGVVDGEDVIWIKGFLHLLHKVEGGIWKDLLHESLADLANTMMVRQAAALLENLITALILNFLVDVDDLFSWDVRVSIVVTEVDIYSSTSLIDLGNTEGYEEAILLDTTVRASLDESFSNL